MCSTTLKQIAISKRNYELLKKLGGAGDSFNDVISQLLKDATVIAIDKREREEKLISAHSSVGSPEERQAVVTTKPQQHEGGGSRSNG
jgi:predicted CopG family antitoxin